jgi:putative SOS response-associated peptidase YedK
MCNSYRITPKGRAEQGVSAEVAAAAARLPSPLVRKSDKGVVVLKDGQVQVMRWGFARSFNSSVNNTRSDKVGEGMWAEAFRDRRCVIPAFAFYEWGPGPAGKSWPTNSAPRATTTSGLPASGSPTRIWAPVTP